MPMTHATPLPHASGAPRFALRRSLLAELGADAALLAAWALLWTVFTLALAPPPSHDVSAAPPSTSPAAEARPLQVRSAGSATPSGPERPRPAG